MAEHELTISPGGAKANTYEGYDGIWIILHSDEHELDLLAIWVKKF